MSDLEDGIQPRKRARTKSRSQVGMSLEAVQRSVETEGLTLLASERTPSGFQNVYNRETHARASGQTKWSKPWEASGPAMRGLSRTSLGCYHSREEAALWVARWMQDPAAALALIEREIEDIAIAKTLPSQKAAQKAAAQKAAQKKAEQRKAEQHALTAAREETRRELAAARKQREAEDAEMQRRQLQEAAERMRCRMQQPQACDSDASTSDTADRLDNLSDDALMEHVICHAHNVFACLGLQRGSCEADVRRQYKKLALRIHPDKNAHPRAKAAFAVIENARRFVPG